MKLDKLDMPCIYINPPELATRFTVIGICLKGDDHLINDVEAYRVPPDKVPDYMYKSTLNSRSTT